MSKRGAGGRKTSLTQPALSMCAGGTLDDRGQAFTVRADEAAARPAQASLWLVLAAIGAIWLVAACRWVWADSVVPWDSKNQFYAFFRFLAESLHAGTTIFWNPYHYGGHPSIADPQSLVFSPPFLLWAWFDRTPSLRSFDLIVYAHVLVGGLAMAGLGKRRQWTGSATVLAAAVFMLGGAASARLNHTGIIICYGLFPIALLTLEIALERRSFRYALIFAVIVSTIVLARNQVALMLCLALSAFFVREIAAAAKPLAFVQQRSAIIAVMAVTVVAITIIPILLTLQLAALSNRPEVSLASALEASLYPANIASLFIPNVFGSHAEGFGYWGPQYSILPDVSATDDSFNYMFVGLAPAMLLLWIGIAGGKLGTRGARTMTLILALSLLFSLGRYSPLFPFVFEYVPGFAFFRRPVDGLFLIGIAIALLTGHLLSDYARNGLPQLGPFRTAAVLSSILATLAGAISVSAMTENSLASITEIARAIPIAAIVAIILVVARSNRQRTMAASLVTLVSAAELLSWNAASRLNAERRTYYQVLETASTEDAEALRMLSEELERRHWEGARPRVEIIGLDGPWQNLAVVRKFEATNGYNPLRIGIYDRFVSPGETAALVTQRKFPATFENYDCLLARALGLEYLVIDRPIEKMLQLRHVPNVETMMAGPKIWIYRLPGAMPRARFHARVEVADVDATTLNGYLRNPPTSDHVVIDDETPPVRQPWASHALSENSQAHIVSWRPGETVIDVDARSAGVLVLRDIYYPGWIAELDGEEVPILRADVLFRAIEVPPGRHKVVFRFAPITPTNLGNAIGLLFNRPSGRPRGS